MAEKKKQVQPKHHAPKDRKSSALRRKKIIKAAVKGENLTEAAIKTGLSPKTASSQVSQILKEPKVQLTFKQMLDKVVPDETLAAKYQELTGAKKVISAMVIGSEGMTNANSMTRDFVEVDDCAVQLKCADSISKLKGHLVEKHEMDFSGALMAMVKKQLNGGNGKGNHKGTNGKS